MILVIDASVAVKWFVEEERCDLARDVFREGSELTIYQEHNRKRIKVDKVPVELANGESATYVGERVKLVILNKTQPSTGRNIASLQGEVGGEKVSATLSCAN